MIDGISTQQLAGWAAEARERWTVVGLAVGVLSDGKGFVNAATLATRVR